MKYGPADELSENAVSLSNAIGAVGRVSMEGGGTGAGGGLDAATLTFPTRRQLLDSELSLTPPLRSTHSSSAYVPAARLRGTLKEKDTVRVLRTLSEGIENVLSVTRFLPFTAISPAVEPAAPAF